MKHRVDDDPAYRDIYVRQTVAGAMITMGLIFFVVAGVAATIQAVF